MVLGPKRRLEGHRAPKKPPGRVLGTFEGAKSRFCTWLREPDFEYYRGRRAKIEGSREAPVLRRGRPSLGRGGPGDGVRELPEGGGGKPPLKLEVAQFMFLNTAWLPEVTGGFSDFAHAADPFFRARGRREKMSGCLRC